MIIYRACVLANLGDIYPRKRAAIVGGIGWAMIARIARAIRIIVIRISWTIAVIASVVWSVIIIPKITRSVAIITRVVRRSVAIIPRISWTVTIISRVTRTIVIITRVFLCLSNQRWSQSKNGKNARDYERTAQKVFYYFSHIFFLI